MSTEGHGMSIGIERIGSEFLLTLKVVGKLTHQDYKVITPMIDAALQGVKDPKVKVILDVTEMQGWELRAAWDDFQLGLKHGSEFYRVAIYGNKDWQQMAAKVGSWFISGEARFFDNRDDALAWLQQ